MPARPSTSPCACWAAASGCTCGSPSPDPGRILTETNLDTGVVTEFTVAPRDGRSRTLAGMSSEWETQGGLRGLADRLVTPRLMGRMRTASPPQCSVRFTQSVEFNRLR